MTKDAVTNPSHVLELNGVGKTYRAGLTGRTEVVALEGATFSVRQNTAFGFLGPNGAGKTTTIKIVTGLIFPTTGSVSILGATPQSARIRARMGYLPENPSFPDHLSGRELLRYSGELLRMPKKALGPAVDRALELVDLTRAAKLQIRKYSKGMVQRLGIAQAILHDPELVILDEPMSGLDPIGRRDIKDLILNLRQAGKTVFFSTHIISDVEEICDDVAMVVSGKVVRQGAVKELIGSGDRDIEILATDLRADALEESPLNGLAQHSRTGNVSALVVKDQVALREAVERIWGAGGKVTSVRVRRYGLEDVFMEEVRKGPQRPTVGE